jgi:hypothetical protein
LLGNRKYVKYENKYRSFQVKRCQRGLFPTRPSSISLKIGIVRVFSKKQTYIFYVGQKPPTKKLQGYHVFDFPQFLHHTFFDNSTSFYCRNLCLGALERYFIEQNSKNQRSCEICHVNSNFGTTIY